LTRESKPEPLQEEAAQNDKDLMSSDALLVLARDGAGGEMFAEVALARMVGMPIHWVGDRFILSAFRAGVVRHVCLGDALDTLGQAAT
jgi:hypothetical protein